MNERLLISMAVVLCSFVLAGAPIIAQGPPGAASSTVITKAVPDLTDPLMPRITLEGTGFGTTPQVRIGFDMGTLLTLTVVGTPTDTLIVADLPLSIAAATYVLIVEAGQGSKRIDAIDVTIGTVGPSGPSGPSGASVRRAWTVRTAY